MPVLWKPPGRSLFTQGFSAGRHRLRRLMSIMGLQTAEHQQEATTAPHLPPTF